MAVLGILQTIPSMVMFGLLLPVTGIGKPTAIIVLTIYSILPILRNTYTGITEVSNGYIEAATGMGMNSLQIFFRVELPLALPVIVTGIRLSSVYIISWATVAAIIGGGGLGILYTGLTATTTPLFDGFHSRQPAGHWVTIFTGTTGQTVEACGGKAMYDFSAGPCSLLISLPRAAGSSGGGGDRHCSDPPAKLAGLSFYNQVLQTTFSGMLSILLVSGNPQR